MVQVCNLTILYVLNWHGCVLFAIPEKKKNIKKNNLRLVEIKSSPQ